MTHRNVLAFLLLVFSLALPAWAADPDSEPIHIQDLTPQQQSTAREVIESIWSPYCPGMTLEACTSGKAEVLRKEVRSMAARGMSYTEIENQLAKRFGDQIRAVPPTSGRALIVWIAPYVLLAMGMILVVVLLTRWLKSRPETEAPAAKNAKTPGISEEMDQRIDELMAEEDPD